MSHALFISCPRSLEYLLADELQALGLKVDKVTPQGVFGSANLSVIYQLCLWSRLANRIHLILFNGEVHNEQTLYKLGQQFPWQTVFTVDKSFAIEFHGTSTQLRNTMYSAQVLKDSIVDHFRSLGGERPHVERSNPDILIQAHLKQDKLTVSFDLTGYSLHQRGYRLQAGEAPIKENLAAALLIRANWPQLAAQGYGLLDPLCGSGTLVIEAAMMAAQVAPGLIRQDQSLTHWVQHQSSLWEKMRHQALQQVKPMTLAIAGSDSNPILIEKAQANAERAGVAPLVKFQCMDYQDARPNAPEGLLICNPPYGERLSDATPLLSFYQALGGTLHQHFQGWRAAVLTSNPLLAKAIGLRADKQYAFYNGPIDCKLYQFVLDAKNQLKTNQPEQFSEGGEMFANRLKKNFQHLQKWAKREQISCYRVYDADLPEYAFAIDLYDDYAVLQEYVAPSSVPIHKAEQRALEVSQITPVILQIPTNHLVIKQRRQQKGKQQYQKMDKTNAYHVVQEGRAQLNVNLHDYLDTGLFLDHRPLRQRFGQLRAGTRFLNCFCYTATASIHAALAGAVTTNIDLSKTYIQWAEDNFRLNKLALNKQQFIQADCIDWLKHCRDHFDVIFLDPPSFSNSKRMPGTLDIQRDHETLIDSAMRLLFPEGELYFSTNFRQFKLSPAINERYQVKDISRETIDEDFKRNLRIHQCFVIKKR